MKKIRIFQFPIRNNNGGVTHYAINNWKYLDKDRFECDFGTLSKQLDFAEELEALGARIQYISCYAEENPLQFAKEVKQILKSGCYDVVHLHTGSWKSFLLEQIAMECQIPKIIVHSHSTRIDINDMAARQKAEEVHAQRKKEFNLSLATDFWACSKAAADWLYGPQIPRARIQIMNNAIDVKRFVFDGGVRDRYRRELGLEGCFVIGHVGRMSHAKNHGFLMEMLEQVSKRLHSARLLLVGDGAFKAELMRKADDLGIADKVVFLGNREDVPQLLQAMDLFCLPSLFEGLPIVLVEAQASGLKCLASDQITKEVRLTENIEFVPLDVDIWAETVLDVSKGYKRRDMYEEITEAGYNIERQIKKVEEQYLL